MNIASLSIEQLKQAISIKEEIAALEHKLAELTGGKVIPVISAEAGTVAVPAKRGRKKLSPEAKAKMAAAASARWAKIKGTASAADKVAPAAKPAKKGKRELSPEGRAAIVAAMKKRWAAKK